MQLQLHVVSGNVVQFRNVLVVRTNGCLGTGQGSSGGNGGGGGGGGGGCESTDGGWKVGVVDGGTSVFMGGATGVARIVDVARIVGVAGVIAGVVAGVVGKAVAATPNWVNLWRSRNWYGICRGIERKCHHGGRGWRKGQRWLAVGSNGDWFGDGDMNERNRVGFGVGFWNNGDNGDNGNTGRSRVG